MAKNILVINVDIRETRVALIENGIIAELHIERESSQGTLGNIYLGKVSRVLPGMQAAFIDVGLERAAFLHVEDLIRPADFEAYLSGKGGRGGAAAENEDRASGPAVEEALAAEEAVNEAQAAAEAGREVIEAPERAIGGLGAQPLESIPPADSSGPGEGTASDAERLDREDEDEAWGAEPEPADEGGDLREPDEAGEPLEAEGDAVREPEDDEAEAEAVGREPEDEEEAPAFEPATAEALAEEAVAVALEPVAGLASEAPAAPRARGRRPSRGGRVRRSGRTSDRRRDEAAPGGAGGGAAPQQAQGQRGQGQEARGQGQGGRQRDPKHGGERGRDGRGGDRGREGRGDRGRERRGGDRGREGRGGNGPLRVSKTTPIRDVVREGQEVIVQISKEPIGTKGARVTSHISLPGRYVVYLPTVEHIGISKRIGSDKERQRLRESIEAMKPPTGGLIVRTLAEGLTKKQLKADVGYLVRLWGEIAKKREETRRAPACLYTELDLVTKTARDLFSDDVEKIVIDDREQYTRLKRFVEMFMPERADAVELYEGEEPIFDAYGIEDEIGRALGRKVPLPSGGYLIIDQAEALTAIDVNTGRFVGKGSKDLEETILTTNLEAVEEIAYQLRFRNIGGLIILDLIDMDRAQNREKVRRKLEQLLAKDKAKTTLNRISELGLIEMTRKRTRESLGRTIHEPCFYCDGTGQLQSKQTISYEILRQIRRERMNLRGYSVVVNAHPAVVDFLKNDERTAVQEAEKRFQRRIELVPRKEYHLEQFDLQGK